MLPASNRTARSGAQRNLSRAPSPSIASRRLGLVDHVDVHALAQRFLDRVVHHVEHRDRLALAPAVALGQREPPGGGAAEAGLAGVGVDQQRAGLAPGQRPQRGRHAVDRPPASHRLDHLVHQVPLGGALPGLPHRQRRAVDGRERGVLGIEPRGAEQPLDQVVVEERLQRPGLLPGAGHDDAVRRVGPVDGEELAGDGVEMPLLLRPDAVVVGVLAPAARAVLVAVEALAPGAVGAETVQLMRWRRRSPRRIGRWSGRAPR